jgi:hypothetical protein
MRAGRKDHTYLVPGESLGKREAGDESGAAPATVIG